MNNNFWKTILRYPSFFFSSMLGLSLVILTPLKNILKLKNKKSIILILFLIFILAIIIFLIISNMTAI